MLFEAGFFGTRAPMYMDGVTLYFAFLPVLVAFAIMLAVKGHQRAHYQMQMATFVVTLIVVIVFEVGVRIGGGFLEYSKASSVDLGFFVIFLIVHVLIAIGTVVAWAYTIYTARRAYLGTGSMEGHKRLGRKVFAGITITSCMGVAIYVFLFVM